MMSCGVMSCGVVLVMNWSDELSSGVVVVKAPLPGLHVASLPRMLVPQ